jgi:PII-like signaling protein
MQTGQPARLLEIHLAEGDRYGGKPLCEVLLAKCQEMGIAGATVFRGIEGYGETAAIHRKHLLANYQPIVVVIIDSEENIGRILPILEEFIDTAMITASRVTAKRVQSSAAE